MVVQALSSALVVGLFAFWAGVRAYADLVGLRWMVGAGAVEASGGGSAGSLQVAPAW